MMVILTIELIVIMMKTMIVIIIKIYTAKRIKLASNKASIVSKSLSVLAKGRVNFAELCCGET